MGPVPYKVRAYPTFLLAQMTSISSLNGMLVHCTVTPSSKFAGIHLYTWVKRGTVRVKCQAPEHNVVLWSGPEPGRLNPEYSMLTIRPPCLQQVQSKNVLFVIFYSRIAVLMSKK